MGLKIDSTKKPLSSWSIKCTPLNKQFLRSVDICRLLATQSISDINNSFCEDLRLRFHSLEKIIRSSIVI